MNRFQQLFSNPGKKAFIPFFMLGDPTPENSLELIKTAIDAGADALELGIPFSDPIADGPIIQASAERALHAGTNFSVCVQLLKKIRAYSQIPIGLLVYFNLLYRQGIQKAHQTLHESGVDAILAVDLPLEESNEHEASLKEHQLGCIELIAPNTSSERALELLNHSSAFTYIVSGYGTTGVQQQLQKDLFTRIAELKALSNKPLVLGFGIKNASQVHELFQHSEINGVIIGSAITEMIAANLNTISTTKEQISSLVTQSIAR